jgi:hypothetical protein
LYKALSRFFENLGTSFEDDNNNDTDDNLVYFEMLKQKHKYVFLKWSNKFVNIYCASYTYRLNSIQTQINQQTELLKLLVKTTDIKTEYEENDVDTFNSSENLKAKKNAWGTNIANVRLRNMVLQRVMDSKSHTDQDD